VACRVIWMGTGLDRDWLDCCEDTAVEVSRPAGLNTWCPVDFCTIWTMLPCDICLIWLAGSLMVVPCPGRGRPGEGTWWRQT
jgi:hypothetical protein